MPKFIDEFLKQITGKQYSSSGHSTLKKKRRKGKYVSKKTSDNKSSSNKGKGKGPSKVVSNAIKADVKETKKTDEKKLGGISAVLKPVKDDKAVVNLNKVGTVADADIKKVKKK